MPLFLSQAAKRAALLVSLLSSYTIEAQVNSDPSSNVPNVLFPSPDASSLHDFTNFASATSSGAFTKEISLFDFIEGDIKVPVTLAYYGAGFQVEHSASWVGLGWSLNAGGVVNRKMVGSPDNWSGGTLGKGYLALTENYDYNYLIAGPQSLARHEKLKEIALGCYDAEPDEFSFVANGKNGVFNFHWDSFLSDPEDVMEVDSDTKTTVIPVWSNGFNSELIGWHIYTGDGFLYKYEAVETITVNSSNVFDCLFSWKQVYNSSWFLTEIQNPSRSRYVRFEYADYSIDDYSVTHSHSVVHRLGGNHSSCAVNYAGELDINTTTLSIGGKRLSRIYGSHTDLNIEFIPGINRGDFNGTDIHALGEVHYKKGTTTLNKFALQHDYSAGRLTLRELQQITPDETEYLPPYKFDYEGNLADRGSVTDHWGYSAGNQTACDGSIGSHIPTYMWYDGYGNKHINVNGGKEPGYEASVGGMLSRITYPTGGYESIQYELNDYSILANAGTVINEPEGNCVSVGVTARGQTDVDCGGNGLVTDTKTALFTIPLHPITGEAITLDVRIVPNIFFYTTDHFGGGNPPEVSIHREGDGEVARFSQASHGIATILELESGNYILKAEATFKSCSTMTQDIASASLSYQSYTGDILYSKIAGGVRLKKVEKYDLDGKLLLETSYKYVDENGVSSGVITHAPYYVSYDDYNIVVQGGSIPMDASCAKVSVRSGSLLSSRHLGYERVEVINSDGGAGKTIIEYRIVPDQVSVEPPYHRSISHFLNGSIKKKILRSNTGEDVLTQTTGITYAEKRTQSLKVGFKGGEQLRENYFDMGGYQLVKGHYKSGITSATYHYPEGDFTIINENEYDEDVHNLRISRQSVEDGYIIQRLYYPEDYSITNASIQGLVDNHMFAQPIEIINIEEIGGSELVTGATFFNYDGTYIKNLRTAPLKTQVEASAFEFSVDNAGNIDARYPMAADERFEFDKNNNNLIAKQSRSGATEVYVWGYNYSKPVLKIDNASKAEVDALLTAQDLTTLKDGPSSGELTEIINRLSASLPQAIITGYLYEIGFGISEIQDPNGMITRYEYDGLGRLVNVKVGGETVKSYNYKYHRPKTN